MKMTLDKARAYLRTHYPLLAEIVDGLEKRGLKLVRFSQSHGRVSPPAVSSSPACRTTTSSSSGLSPPKRSCFSGATARGLSCRSPSRSCPWTESRRQCGMTP